MKMRTSKKLEMLLQDLIQRIVRAELKRRECNAMGHAFVCIRRPFEF